MRKITRIVIHCSATAKGRPFTVADIWSWHTDPKPRGNGWKNPGYHYVIGLEGERWPMQPLNKPSNGARSFNRNSIHICYIGGMSADGQRPEDTRTRAQKRELRVLIAELQTMFPLADVCGHRSLDAGKACPSFDVGAEFD